MITDQSPNKIIFTLES
jgi:hypothetical protein